MNELKVFSFKNNNVRSVIIDDEPWFVGKDVAEVLGYSNPRDALSRHVEEDDKADVVIHDGSQNRNVTGINESGLYALILSSKLSQAKEFKRWVTSEVLPSIRRTGTFGLNNRDKFELAGLISKCKNTKAVDALMTLFEINKPIRIQPASNTSVSDYLAYIEDEQLVGVPTQQIYDNYKSYCKTNKIIPLSLCNFSKEVRKITGAVVKRHRVNGKLTGFYVLG
jgi:prophage antirepressor-like protein